MRYVRYLCIAVFAIALIFVSLANRAVVPLDVLPKELAHWFAVNPHLDVPLFLVIHGSIVLGLLIGFVWEWVREYGQRSQASQQAREIRRLEREIARLKGKKHETKDEVLALLDEVT
jgi:putative membrane protein